MKRKILFKLLLVIIFFATVGFSQDKIALILKVRGETSIKRSTDSEFKKGLKIGDNIYSRDKIKTGKDGFVVLVFLDDKSQIKIRENSEMEISGERNKGSISKQVDMQFGTLKAEVNPTKKGDFVIATPTSVASVKGTVFWVISDPVNGDVFYGISGSIEVTNNKGGGVIVVGANQTGVSTPAGNVNVENTPAGAQPIDEDAEEFEKNNELKIQLRNPSGETKTIKIEYK
ncbi:MAG TPA: FecR family protein [Candidatus Marinimicrobia bacterium]|nr:FecR family protein [Candidatus Neomarinimicrobiota bacterium]HRS52573.1 FecR family protein [Candidatus Neomarinimicrobiota bacterium]HRU93167.1 FecR family protein [Candidatus Neomarinimicrobiota bacterium]